MIPSFFASGQPNYSRWMMKYHLNLLNIDITHPGVKEFLEQGALSIRRRQKLSHSPLLTRYWNKLSRQALFHFPTQRAKRIWMLMISIRSELIGELINQS